MNESNFPKITKRHFLAYTATAFGIGALGGVAGSLFWPSNSTEAVLTLPRLG